MLPPVRVRTAGDEPVPVVDGVHAAIGRAPVLMRPVLDGALGGPAALAARAHLRVSAVSAP